MNAEVKKLLAELETKALPPGWECEAAWPWRDGVHLVAPDRRGGIIIHDRNVRVQLPGSGPARDVVDIGEYRGRGWFEKLVTAAVRAVHDHAHHFESGSTIKIRGKLGTHATATFFVLDGDGMGEPPSVGERILVRSDEDQRVARPTDVLVDMIKFGDFYYLSFC